MNIPFTTEEFFQVIERYNTSLFPSQVFILILGLVAVVLLHNKRTFKNRLIGGFLGFLWLWTGFFYHGLHFTAINKAAYGFGAIFILQGLFFLYEVFIRKRLIFEFKANLINYLAYFFIWFGLIIYPILIYALEGSFDQVISLGLPCPTTIVTFGFLMITHRSFSKYLLIIPTIWAIIGTGAAINFGVLPDYLMLISAVVANIYLFGRRKQLK